MNLDANPVGSRSSEKIQPKALPLSSSGHELVMSHDIFDDMELGDLFSEDVPPYEPLPHELLELQKKQIMRELRNEKNLGKLEGIWKNVSLHVTRSYEKYHLAFQITIANSRSLMLLLNICVLLFLTLSHMLTL